MFDLERHIEIRESPAKPGDYVLLRALEDLVVVVTACSVDCGVLTGGQPKELLLESLRIDCSPFRPPGYHGDAVTH